jgi:two-component system OmpR family response regulator
MWPARQTFTDSARVVVLLDQASTRRRLCARLAAQGHLVLADALGAEASGLLRDLRPQVVVVEWAGPADSVVGDLRSTLDETSWIALVADDPLVRAAALASGFDDVVAPPYDPYELVARVEAVLARRNRRRRLEFGDVRIDLDGHEVWREGQPVSLTATEFRLLVTLLRHPGQVLSKRQLLELVWGFDDYDANVVEVQVSALRRKLEVLGPRLIHTVRGVGYVARLAQGAPRTSTSTV